MCFQAAADVWLLTCLLVGVDHAVSQFGVEHLLRAWESSGSPWALRKQGFFMLKDPSNPYTPVCCPEYRAFVVIGGCCPCLL